MAIIRVQHIGLAVRDMHATCERFDRLFGLKCQDFRDDQGRGMQYDSRILLGNDCWLHVVQNWNPEARVYQFLERQGEGLEHIALESDDIEADVQRVRDAGVPLYQDKVFDAPDGYEAFVYPEYNSGITVELIQPHATSWNYPQQTGPVSDKMGLIRLQHIGVVVQDQGAACQLFEKLFGLGCRDFRDDQGKGMQYDSRILLGNECWLHVVQNWNPESRVSKFLAEKGEGLEHLALQTTSIEADVQHLRDIDVPVFQDKVFDANDGYESFVYGQHNSGVTVELIQPHAHSWDYPAD
jgi:4-hydroxyphenylpyruvate dioxygenase-like putative hemolysin